MIITVDINDLETVQDQGSVIQVTGTSEDNPTQRITFAGDHRSMHGLLAMVEDQGDVTCVVEDWQVLGTHVVEPA